MDGSPPPEPPRNPARLRGGIWWPHVGTNYVGTFRDWSDEETAQFREDAEEYIFRQLDSQPLTDAQYENAQVLFEAGWLTFGEYDKDTLDAIRGEFYDLMGIHEDDFDWQEYRELYSDVG